MAPTMDTSIEFLGFIADISHPATGEILCDRLAAWLGLSQEGLEARWHSSGRSEWSEFANDVLSVLDAVHDHAGSMLITACWHLQGDGQRPTPDELVAQGKVGRAISYARQFDLTEWKCPIEELQGVLELDLNRRTG